MIQIVLVFMLFFCSFNALSEDTVLKYYNPFDKTSVKVPIVVKKKWSGICVGQSKLILREDAWRCMAEGKTFDPCFAKSGDNIKKVTCLQSPWTGEGIQIQLNSSLNNEHHISLDMSRTFPWAIELVNGERCQAVETADLHDSIPVRYFCGHQNVLLGHLQRCKTEWSILEKTPEGVITAQLKTAWF